MLKRNQILPICLLLMATGCGSSNDKRTGQKNDLGSMAVRIARKTVNDDYPKVPGDELLREISGNMLYGELQNRYSQQLTALKAAVDADHAKFILVVMTPEVGKFATNANTYGVPYIVQICANQGIDCVDLTPDVSEWTSVNDPARAPMGGNWSKAGAAFCAQMLAGVIMKYDDYHNATAFSAADRPPTFGDLDPENDAVDDESNKSLLSTKSRSEYRFKVNSQGLRMRQDVKFPKTRQRILFLGDSRILNPYLNDEHTIAERLQESYPEKEFINAGNFSYTMEDYLTLYHEKARFTEPDIVIACTNGGDILDEYFTHRNHYSRSQKCYKPTELERRFYNQMTGRN